MKLKLFIIISLFIGLISSAGCSSADNSQKNAEQASNKFLSQLYTIDSKSGADLLGSPEKMVSAMEIFKPLTTQDGYEQLMSNNTYLSMVVSCGNKQRSLKLESVELKQTGYDKKQGKIYFDYNAKIEINSDKDNKKSNAEEDGNIGLYLDNGQWKVFSTYLTVPSKDIR